MPRHGFRVRGNFILKEFSKRSSYIREEAALKLLQPHPFVTELQNSFCDERKKEKFYGVLTMKYYKGCDLYQWIEYYSNGSPLNFVRYVFKKILLAYDYARKKSIYHRDIKPENIMIDENGMIKLIDWELCSFKRFSARRVGTPEYMAEEVNRGELYECIQSDIWSLGVSMFCLATGRRPYDSPACSDNFDDEWLMAIYDENWRLFWRSHEHTKYFPSLSHSFKFCIEDMLKKEPEDRLHIEYIMSSSFFVGEEMDTYEIIDRMELCSNTTLF